MNHVGHPPAAQSLFASLNAEGGAPTSGGVFGELFAAAEGAEAALPAQATPELVLPQLGALVQPTAEDSETVLAGLAAALFQPAPTTPPTPPTGEQALAEVEALLAGAGVQAAVAVSQEGNEATAVTLPSLPASAAGVGLPAPVQPQAGPVLVASPVEGVVVAQSKASPESELLSAPAPEATSQSASAEEAFAPSFATGSVKSPAPTAVHSNGVPGQPLAAVAAAPLAEPEPELTVAGEPTEVEALDTEVESSEVRLEGATRERGASAAREARPAQALRYASAAPPLLDQVRFVLRPDFNQARVRLDPPGLGNLLVQVNEVEGELSAQIEVERPEVLREIERLLPQLHDAFLKNGQVVTRVEVTLNPEGFAAHAGGHGQQAPDREGELPHAPEQTPTNQPAAEPASPAVHLTAPRAGLDTLA